MATENDAKDTRISNWTLATGTTPSQRALPSMGKVIAVSDDALRSQLLDSLLVDENDSDVIVVESMTRAYSRIRELKPDFVLVFMDIDDSNGCQLLSMLEIDRALRGMTCATEPEHRSYFSGSRIRQTNCACTTGYQLC